jgi:hypothetical protein
MTNETSKNLKVVNDERVFSARVWPTTLGQARIIADHGEFLVNGFKWLDRTSGDAFYYQSIEAAEKVLANWKAQNIPWLTTEQIRACVAESDLAAIECAIIHWKQIQAAGLLAFKYALDKGMSAWHSELSCIAEYQLCVIAFHNGNSVAFDANVSALIDRFGKVKEELMNKTVAKKNGEEEFASFLHLASVLSHPMDEANDDTILVGMSVDDAEYFVQHMPWAVHYRDERSMRLFKKIEDAISRHKQYSGLNK